jgi:hypothetical protein|mmetsp:Transcript_2880/g.5392  ORF Transcript_2880/g.5392 Transcript_2880/m.5392 type:complete len:106 (+) Transcript_2880:152-469(+)
MQALWQCSIAAIPSNSDSRVKISRIQTTTFPSNKEAPDRLVDCKLTAVGPCHCKALARSKTKGVSGLKIGEQTNKMTQQVQVRKIAEQRRTQWQTEDNEKSGPDH